MSDPHERNLRAFFEGISAWRAAYEWVRLHVLGVRNGDTLELVAGRLVLDVVERQARMAPFRAGPIEAYQAQLDQDQIDVEDLVRRIAQGGGVEVDGIGRIAMPQTSQAGVYVAPPNLLHSEGLGNGNRLSVLSIGGGQVHELLPQPEFDWFVKAADVPYDSVSELAADFSVGTPRDNRALFEVIAHTTIQVLSESEVVGTSARLGILMAGPLDRARAKIGYRVLHDRKIVARGTIPGDRLNWADRGSLAVGSTEIQVPDGSAVQCIASYAHAAHHVLWRVDPASFLNPRAAVLATVDPSGELIQGFLHPETPPRNKAADDFETAVAWLLWALGFSVASFGTHPKTKDSFDAVAVTPRGDYVVVECTLGILRSDSKLSRLTERTARVREALAKANMQGMRVLPVIVTALPSEQVAADMNAATELGVLVITREDLDGVRNELIRFPDADALFERGLRAVQDRQSALRANKEIQPTLPAQ